MGPRRRRRLLLERAGQSPRAAAFISPMQPFLPVPLPAASPLSFFGHHSQSLPTPPPFSYIASARRRAYPSQSSYPGDGPGLASAVPPPLPNGTPQPLQPYSTGEPISTAPAPSVAAGYPGMMAPAAGHGAPAMPQQQYPAVPGAGGQPAPSAATAQFEPPVNLRAHRHVLPTAPVRPTKPPLDRVHSRVNCDGKYMRSTLAAVPATSSLLNKTRLPFALHMQPYCSDNIPVVDNLCITRCASCRTYINPFATFVQNGTRWRCNLCLRINDLPSNFDYDRLTNAAIDRASRADLNEASVEYIAPKEYMVRPPQPCCYVFAVDISAPAVASGELEGTVVSPDGGFISDAVVVDACELTGICFPFLQSPSSRDN